MLIWYEPVIFFLTLSLVEYSWQRLDNYLRKGYSNINNGKSTPALISLDPVSIVDNESKPMIDFITSKDAPLGKVTHYA